MVEFGIFKGGSIALYEELYSPKRLVGVDVRDERVPALDAYLEGHSATDRVRLYYGTDQGDRDALHRIAKENFDGERLDVVIDDGSHRYEPSKASLNVFLPLLRPGGLYVIEDWSWAHWPGPYHQENAASGQYSDQRYPLTKLIFEAVMLAASRPGIVRDIYIDDSRAFLTRGKEEINDPAFDISMTYLTSLWTMQFENPVLRPIDLNPVVRPIDIWRGWFPLTVRRRVPPTFAAWVRRSLAQRTARSRSS
jgi:hypothetical protein